MVPLYSVRFERFAILAAVTIHGRKMYETDSAPCLAVLLADDLLSAAPGSLAVRSMCESAEVYLGLLQSMSLVYLVPTVTVWCCPDVCHLTATN